MTERRAYLFMVVTDGSGIEHFAAICVYEQCWCNIKNVL